MAKSEFGITVMYRILKKAGAARVSDESAEELRRTVEEVADGIAKGAVEMAGHANRRTVKGEDVRMATRHYRL